MAEELELDLTEGNETINKTEERIKNLSSKAKTFAEERDAERAKAEAEAQARQDAEKERDFYKTFSTLATKYPGATDYQDKILEKVKAGYSEEDATVSVLNAEGKFSPAPQQQTPVMSAGGGSAATTIPMQDQTIETMTREDKRQALMDLEKEGEVSQILRRGWQGN